MGLFMMSGEPVLNSLDYRRLFNVYDALKGHARLASFAQTHLRMDYISSHHADMIRRANQGEHFEDRPDFYWAAFQPDPDLPRADAEPDAGERETALRIYGQTGEISPEQERLRICATATAAILLAGAENPDPLDPQQALDAWQGRETVRSSEVGGRIESDLVLCTCREPYELPALDTKPEKLCIETRRISVQPVSRQDGSRSALLKVREETEEVPRGEWVYVNVHDGLATHILPNRVRNGEKEMARSGNELVITGGGATQRISAEGVTSFAPEAFENGCLLIRDNRLDISLAWRRSTDSGLQWLAERKGAVEVQTRGQYYLVLLANGRVISDNPAWDDSRGITKLDEIGG